MGNDIYSIDIYSLSAIDLIAMSDEEFDTMLEFANDEEVAYIEKLMYDHAVAMVALDNDGGE